MKYTKLTVDQYPSAKCGDLLTIENQTYEVIGYTDAGSKLLVRIPGEFECFKLVLATKKAVS